MKAMKSTQIALVVWISQKSFEIITNQLTKYILNTIIICDLQIQIPFK